MDFSSILQEIHQEIQPFFGQGKVASYIPELKKVNPNQFGMCVETVTGEVYSTGDVHQKFSIQSISKVFTLVMALRQKKKSLWGRVGVEPSGNPFNSLIQLEYEKGIPRNPFINAGALVITDVLLSAYSTPAMKVLEFLRKLSKNPSLDFNEQVARSEKAHRFRNEALANFIKSYGNIHNEIDQLLDVYFHNCSIEMNCLELAKSFLLFANHGILPATQEEILSESYTKRLNAVMATCGFYDEAGEFAFKVGLPGKSGVGGGIAAVLPCKLSVAVWSPELNQHGNSIIGMKALELFTSKTQISIF